MPSLVALLPAFCEKTAFSTLEVATRTGLNLSPSQQGRPFSLSAEFYVSLLHLIHPENVVKNIRRRLIFKGSFFKSISFFQAYRVATVFEAIALLSVRYSWSMKGLQPLSSPRIIPWIHNLDANSRHAWPVLERPWYFTDYEYLRFVSRYLDLSIHQSLSSKKRKNEVDGWVDRRGFFFFFFFWFRNFLPRGLFTCCS